MKTVYICSPLRGDYAQNTEKAKAYSRAAALMDVIPITPHIYLTQFLDDEKPPERALGLHIGLAMLASCEELWQFGTPSEGMKGEIAQAKRLGIPVLDGVEMIRDGRA